MAARLELESLVTQMVMDHEQFLKGTIEVNKAFDSVVAKAREFEVLVTRSVERTANAVEGSIRGLAAAVAQMNGVITVMASMETAAGNLAISMAAIGNLGATFSTVREEILAVRESMTALSLAGASLSEVARPLEAIAGASRSLGGVSAGLREFITTISVLEKGTGNIELMSSSLKSLFDSMAKISTQSSQVGELFAALNEGIPKLRDAAVRLTPAATSIGKMGAALSAFPTDLDALKASGDHISALADGLAKLPRAIEGFVGIGRSINTIAGQITKLGAAISELAGAEANLNSLKEGLKSLGQVGKSMANVKDGLSGLGASLSALVPGVNALSGAQSAFSAAANSLSLLSGLGPGIEQLNTAMGGLPTKFANIAKSTTSGTATKVIDDFATALQKLAPAAGALTAVNTELGTLFNSLSTMITDMPAINRGSTALANIGKFLEAVTLVPIKKIDKIAPALDNFGKAFSGSVAQFATADMQGASKTLSGFGSFLDAAGKFKFNPQVFADIEKSLTSVFGALGAVAQTPGIEAVNKSLSKLTNYLNAVGRVSVDKIGSIAGPISTFFGDIGKIDTGTSEVVLSHLNRFNGVIGRLGKADPKAILAQSAAIKTMMRELSTIPVSDNLNKVANVLSRVSSAMRGITSATGGGKGPVNWNPLRNILGGFNGVPPAANSASSAVSGFGNSLKALVNNTGIVGTALNGIRMSFAGLYAYGTIAFAKLDDSLIRLMAHTRDWNQESRGELQAGVFGISGNSTSSSNDLVKSLEYLTAAGMNSAMAIRALGNAENFAVAGGMSVEKASRRLADIMVGTGLDNVGTGLDAVEEYHKRMVQLSDLITGTARKMGSTEDQLSEAFSGRFMTAMRQSKVGIEDATLMLGMMSRAGLRGSHGGDILATLLQTMQLREADTHSQFSAMAGLESFNDRGEQIPVMSMMELLNKKLASTGTSPLRRAAQLEQMGFDRRTIPAIEAILSQMNNLAEMRRELGLLGDTTAMTADMIRGSFLSALKMAWNNVTNMASVIGGSLAPALAVLINGLSGATKWFTELNPAFQNLIVIGGALYLATMLPLLRVFTALAAIATGPIRLAFSGLYAIGSVVGGAVVGGVRLLISSLAALPGVISSVWKGLYNTASFIIRGIDTVMGVMVDGIILTFKGVAIVFNGVVLAFTNSMMAVGSVVMFVKGLYKLTAASFVAMMDTFWTAVYDGFSIAKAGVVGVLKGIAGGILPFLIWLASFIVLFLPMLLLASAALAGVGAVVVTVGLGIGNLFSAFSAAIPRMWGGFKSGASEAFDWASAKAISFGDSLARIWEGNREGLQKLFEGAVNFLKNLAGFFWNFRENARVVGEWLAEYWKEALEDIGKAAATIFENLVLNVRAVFIRMWEVAKGVFSALWWGLVESADYAFTWVKANWSILVDNMGVAFKGFVRALAENFEILFKLFRFLLDSVTRDMQLRAAGGLFGYSDEQKEEILGKRKEQRGEAIIKTIGAMKGPADFIEASDFKGLTKIDRTFGKDTAMGIPGGLGILGNVAGQIAYYSKMAMKDFGKDMNPLLKGFEESAIWSLLQRMLNLTLPEDAVSKSIEALTKTFSPSGEQGEMGNAIGGKSPLGQGGFKQISLNRTMVNTPASEGLDYQQLVTLQQINKGIQTLISANGGWNPTERPVILGY